MRGRDEGLAAGAENGNNTAWSSTKRSTSPGVRIQLLYDLDPTPSHSSFLVVGDGRQPIYLGALSLRSLGIDMRGRARVLTSNWPTTWSAGRRASQ